MLFAIDKRITIKIKPTECRSYIFPTNNRRLFTCQLRTNLTYSESKQLNYSKKYKMYGIIHWFFKKIRHIEPTVVNFHNFEFCKVDFKFVIGELENL